jgi:Flp pilus assembly pilin Flp
VTVRLSILAVGALAAARDRLLNSLRRDEGQAFVEYALVLVVISLVVGAALLWSPLGKAISGAVTNVSNQINP